MIETLPNPLGIKKHPYHNMMTVMNSKGGLLFQWQTCKETLYCYFFSVAVMHGDCRISQIAKRDGDFDFDNPRFVITNHSKDAGERILESLALLHREMGLRKPRVFALDGASGVWVFEVDPIFARSSVAMHACFTFARMVRHRTYDFSSINSMMRTVLLQSRIDNASADEAQLYSAENNDNLYGLLNKTLPCLNRSGLDDWFAANKFDDPIPRGIAGYRESYVKQFTTPAKLIKKYGRGMPNSRPPGPNYDAWY